MTSFRCCYSVIHVLEQLKISWLHLNHTIFMLLRPDGEKKAYVRLAPDYDALDVANKVRYFKFASPES